MNENKNKREYCVTIKGQQVPVPFRIASAAAILEFSALIGEIPVNPQERKALELMTRATPESNDEKAKNEEPGVILQRAFKAGTISLDELLSLNKPDPEYIVKEAVVTIKLFRASIDPTRAREEHKALFEQEAEGEFYQNLDYQGEVKPAVDYFRKMLGI